MKIWLVFYHDEYSTREKKDKNTSLLQYAKEKHNVDLEIIDVQKFVIKIENNESVLYYDNKKVDTFPDFVFMRAYNLVLSHFFEANNIKYAPNVIASMISKDKMATHLYLSELGLKMPKTIFITCKDVNNYKYEDVVKELGPRFILKLLDGKAGIGVHLIESEKQFKELLVLYNYSCLLQEFVESSFGRDVRTIVFNGKVTDCYISKSEEGFQSKSDGFTSNKYELTPKLEKISLQIAEKLNLWIAGIDFLFDSDDDFYVCEVNCHPCIKPCETLNYEYVIDEIVKMNNSN